MAEDLLRNLLKGENLGDAQLDAVFTAFVSGDYSPVLMSALLCSLHTRGETPAEISAAVRAFLNVALDFPRPQQEPFIDSAGTGGDGAHTVNISTAASLVVAAGGGKVIKHGNRAISSKSGSADVIKALGIPMPENPVAARRLFDENGFCFLFAPVFHPAIANVMPVRRELAIPTLMNILGPLLNPAKPDYQLMGVGNPQQLKLVAQTMHLLGRKHAMVVNGSGIDEIAVHGPTEIYEITETEINHYTVTPRDLDSDYLYHLEDLRGGDANLNAHLINQVFAAEINSRQLEAIRAAIIANAGAQAYLLGMSDSLPGGCKLMSEILDSGRVASYLQNLKMPAVAEENL